MKSNFLKKIFNVTFVFVLTLFLASSSALMADTEDTITRTFKVSGGGKLTMEVERASIEVEAEKGEVVKVKVILESDTSDKARARKIFDDYKIDFKHSGSDVTIVSDHNGESGLFSWRSSGKLRIRFIVTVPGEYDLDLKTSGGSISTSEIHGDVKAKTSGGSLKFELVKGTVWGKTSGGSIRLEGCTGDAEVKTSGGGIHIGKVNGEVKAHTSGGSISVKEVMGTINASTSGGSVSAYISKQPKGDCSLKTSGGSISVSLAEDIGVDLDAKTSGGRVRTSFPVTIKGELSNKKLQAKINGGGPGLYLRTSGGSIRINKID